MRKSIITKYFGFCSAMIFASVVCVGTVLLLVSSQYYKAERRDALTVVMDEVISATAKHYPGQTRADLRDLGSIYRSYSASSGANFTLVDSEGITVLCSEGETCIHTAKKIPPVALEKISAGDYYFSADNLFGFYNSDYFNLAVQIKGESRTYYIFASEPAAPLEQFQLELIKMFLITTVIVLIIVYSAVYLFNKAMMEPINDMTKAAERFGKGEFSEKIQVSEDNEIGVLAATMNDMAYSLSKLEDTRRSFVANVSHELKTPMTTIGGFIDGILDGTIPEEQHRHYLTIVSEEVSRLARLVRSMLNIAKYETGEMELKAESFDVTALTIKTVLLFEKRIEDKKLEIEGLDSGKFIACADADLIQQIIYNLVENAVKFVNEGGYIAFRFEYVENNKKIQVAIRNSGEGLKQDELPKVFDRFYKTDESHGKDKTGVGLGLSIVRSIINLHNGQIMVRSTPGEYTEFAFTIPAAQQ